MFRRDITRKRVLFFALVSSSIVFMCFIARSSYSIYYDWSILPVEHCSQKYLQMKDGSSIPFYRPRMEKRLLSERLRKCGYVDQETVIECPNVKSDGETVVRQMQLSYGRMLRILHLMSEKHGFRYWLWGGALIGGKRNGRFVSWDEDGDVNMLRKDYEIFLKIPPKEFPSDIFVQRNGTDLEFSKLEDIYIPAKMRDTSTCYLYCLYFKCRYNDGYQIDIRVFDEIKEGKITNAYNALTFDLIDIFPLKKMSLEGFNFMAPQKTNYLLSKNYGSYLSLPEAKKQYTYFIGTPWYSCDEVYSFNKTYKKYLLKETTMGNCLI